MLNIRKLLLGLTFVCGMAASVDAQVVGQKWVGGSIGYSSDKVTKTERTNNYRIIPEIGYILSTKWALGVKLGYRHSEGLQYEEEGVVITAPFIGKTDGYEINPFARYSLLKGDIGGLYVDGGVKYGYYETRNTLTKVKSDVFEIGLRPGIAIALSEKVTLTGRFGFVGYQYTKIACRTKDSFKFDMDMDEVELGINVIF